MAERKQKRQERQQRQEERRQLQAQGKLPPKRPPKQPKSPRQPKPPGAAQPPGKRLNNFHPAQKVTCPKHRQAQESNPCPYLDRLQSMDAIGHTELLSLQVPWYSAPSPLAPADCGKVERHVSGFTPGRNAAAKRQRLPVNSSAACLHSCAWKAARVCDRSLPCTLRLFRSLLIVTIA